MNYRSTKVFRNGGSQAVRVPLAFQLHCDDVWIWRQPGTDDLVLSPRPPDWAQFLQELRWTLPADDFLLNLDPPFPPHGEGQPASEVKPSGCALRPS